MAQKVIVTVDLVQKLWFVKSHKLAKYFGYFCKKHFTKFHEYFLPFTSGQQAPPFEIV